MDSAPIKTKILITPDIAPPKAGGIAARSELFGGDGATFKDFLDVINPLQQIPIVSDIYRSFTGDPISTASRLAGGALLGGPIGFFMALANEIFRTETGHGIGGSVLAAITADDQEIQVAQNDIAPPGAPSPTNRRAYQAYMMMQSVA